MGQELSRLADWHIAMLPKDILMSQTNSAELTPADTGRIAKLAQLKLDDVRLSELTGELNKILGFVQQLQEVDTAGVAPMVGVNAPQQPLRKDEVTDGHKPADILANAPESLEGYFVVPKVVE